MSRARRRRRRWNIRRRGVVSLRMKRRRRMSSLSDRVAGPGRRIRRRGLEGGRRPGRVTARRTGADPAVQMLKGTHSQPAFFRQSLSAGSRIFDADPDRKRRDDADGHPNPGHKTFLKPFLFIRSDLRGNLSKPNVDVTLTSRQHLPYLSKSARR